MKIPNIVTFLLAGEPALRNDQPTETVTPTVPYGSPLKGSVVELRRAWRGLKQKRPPSGSLG
ncbi:TPA: hypothetical protein I4G78_23865 [Enterobacter hormaechei subsp. xiangfangensis]|nr:hypothetical protein [Enterobacter hormaechei subsp. xiangfangensis]